MTDALNVKPMLESVEPYAQALTSVTVPSNVILEALEYVREQPQIVRCKDCIHREKGVCPFDGKVTDEWFCGGGEHS